MKKPESGWCAVFDFDGTLLHSKYNSVFRPLYDGLQLSYLQRTRLALSFRRYGDSHRDDGFAPEPEELCLIMTDVEILLEHGIGPDDLDRTLRGLDLHDGVRECLEWLSTRGVPVGIVSYGVRQFIQRVIEDNGIAELIEDNPAIRHVMALDLTETTDDMGRIQFDGCDESTLVLPSSKGEWSRRFADGYGIPHDRILAVGDSPSDRLMTHLKQNRFGMTHLHSKAPQLEPHFDQVAVTDTFWPAFEWLRRRIENE